VLRVKAKLLNSGRLPPNAQVFLRFGGVKGKRSNYAADMLVINSKASRSSASAAASKDPFGIPIQTAIKPFYGEDDAAIRQARTGVLDNDLNVGPEEGSPEHLRACREFENPLLREALYGPLARKGGFSAKEKEGLFRVAEAAACDRPIPLDAALEATLRDAGWDSPIRIPSDIPQPDGASCSGDLHPAPPPNEATEIELVLKCTQPLTSVGLEMPGGRFAVNWIAPPQLPNCDNESLGTNRYWFFCSGGTLPADTPATVRIQPFPEQLLCNDRIRIYPNPASKTPTVTVFDTDAFATCP
jgi:hypothetical protein